MASQLSGTVLVYFALNPAGTGAPDSVGLTSRSSWASAFVASTLIDTPGQPDWKCQLKHTNYYTLAYQTYWHTQPKAELVRIMYLAFGPQGLLMHSSISSHPMRGFPEYPDLQRHFGGLVGVHSALRPQLNWSQGLLQRLPSRLSEKKID